MNIDEVKYRVVDKRLKKIYTVTMLKFFTNGEILSIEYMVGEEFNRSIFPFEDIILLRCTGVVCKNGESYEGDKVEIRPLSYNPDYPPLGGMIIWDRLSWQIQTTSDELYPEVRYFPLLEYDPQIIEIVGNIHLGEDSNETKS